MVKIADKFYLVETKAERDMNNTNVKQKRLATLDWIGKVNELKPEDRMNCTWYYVLLGERTFYDFSNKEATTEEVLQYALMTKDKVESRLTGFMEQDS